MGWRKNRCNRCLHKYQCEPPKGKEYDISTCQMFRPLASVDDLLEKMNDLDIVIREIIEMIESWRIGPEYYKI